MSEAVRLDWSTLEPGNGRIALVSLNRPQQANAFNGEMVADLHTHFQTVATTDDCRAMILQGVGRNFSAGADLNWMRSFAQASFAENEKEAVKMTAMFEALYNMPVPTLAVARGAAFGGAVGLLSCCDVVVAATDARFCLSEIKVGLLPAVILPYVARKILPGQLRRHMLSGRVMKADEAQRFGLLECVVSNDRLEQQTREELDGLLLGSPAAQKQLKQLYRDLVNDSLRQSPKTAKAIAEARSSVAGQTGMRDFFNKQDPKWLARLPKDWRLHE